MATRSSILAWKISWTEEPGGLQSMGSQRVGHDWATNTWLTHNPMDYSPPGSSVHGILQAKTLEWFAISSSRGSSRPRDQTHVSHIAGGFFTFWATREALLILKTPQIAWPAWLLRWSVHSAHIEHINGKEVPSPSWQRRKPKDRGAKSMLSQTY